MFLSKLVVNVGSDPDRPRPGREWLKNLYHVHQRLCMAFPSAPRKAGDPEFLQPYRPADFGEKQVRVEREADAGFLFRIDPGPAERAVILVQSAVKPDWEYAFGNVSFLAAPPEIKQIDLALTAGRRFRFRLLANPTKRLKAGCPGEKVDGRRVPVPVDGLLDWLVKRGGDAGFSVLPDALTMQVGYIHFSKPRKDATKRDEKARLRSVRFDGILTVDDPHKAKAAIISGIGTGKGFGFGLLSLAPIP